MTEKNRDFASVVFIHRAQNAMLKLSCATSTAMTGYARALANP
jgi:hypothetical protein